MLEADPCSVAALHRRPPTPHRDTDPHQPSLRGRPSNHCWLTVQGGAEEIE